MVGGAENALPSVAPVFPTDHKETISDDPLLRLASLTQQPCKRCRLIWILSFCSIDVLGAQSGDVIAIVRGHYPFIYNEEKSSIMRLASVLANCDDHEHTQLM